VNSSPKADKPNRRTFVPFNVETIKTIGRPFFLFELAGHPWYKAREQRGFSARCRPAKPAVRSTSPFWAVAQVGSPGENSAGDSGVFLAYSRSAARPERIIFARFSASELGEGLCSMPPRLVALDEGPDIMLDRGMVVVGRHPGCDARLESPRVSRHHCCVMPENDEVVVRDLGSTNGIRINGQRVELGRLKAGDEFSVAHVRYRLENGPDSFRPPVDLLLNDRHNGDSSGLQASTDEDVLAAAVRKVLPASVAANCRIQVIIQMVEDSARVETSPSSPPSAPPGEEPPECLSN